MQGDAVTARQRVGAAALALVGLWSAALAMSLWGPAWHVVESGGVEVSRTMQWPTGHVVVFGAELVFLALAAGYVVFSLRRGSRSAWDRLRPALVVALAIGVCAGPLAALICFALTMSVLPKEAPLPVA
jgi:hypothetical protein